LFIADSEQFLIYLKVLFGQCTPCMHRYTASPFCLTAMKLLGTRNEQTHVHPLRFEKPAFIKSKLYLKESIYTCTAVLHSNELKDLYMHEMLRNITMKFTYSFFFGRQQSMNKLPIFKLKKAILMFATTRILT